VRTAMRGALMPKFWRSLRHQCDPAINANATVLREHRQGAKARRLR